MRQLMSTRGSRRRTRQRSATAIAIVIAAVSAIVMPRVSAAHASVAHASVAHVAGSHAHRTSASIVLPHLKLKRAAPSPDTTVTTAPEAIQLWFSEPADLVATRVTVKASNGVAVALRKPVQLPGRDAPIMAAFTTPPAPGRYTVTWKTMSKDGHVVSGQYDFTIGASR